MSLPKWIEEHLASMAVDNDGYAAEIHRALTIAVDALEYGFNGRTIKQPGMSVQSRPLTNSEIRRSLEEALRRVEELGK